MTNKKIFEIADLTFSKKKDITAHFSGILNDALGRDLSGADFDQVLALFRYHRDFEQKTRGEQVVRLWVTHTPRKHVDGYSSVKVFKFSTGAGHEDDFSMKKSIEKLWNRQSCLKTHDTSD